jgi:hypothetical protein
VPKPPYEQYLGPRLSEPEEVEAEVEVARAVDWEMVGPSLDRREWWRENGQY